MKRLIFSILLVTFFYSCNEKDKKETSIDWNTKRSTEMNKQFSAEEDLEINLFLTRKQEWKMLKTGSGLRYYIYENGSGEMALPEDYVDIEYSITLLDGTECYKTDEDEVEEIKVDKAQMESGIQEGIKLMKEGDKAILIIPSHLAHGIVGDLSKIPPLSPLIVKISLLKLYRNPKNIK